MEQQPEQPESHPEPAIPPKKKPWSKPVLTKYGTAADLTKRTAIPGTDTGLVGSFLP
jgi:hypothetical protein